MSDWNFLPWTGREGLAAVERRRVAAAPLIAIGLIYSVSNVPPARK